MKRGLAFSLFCVAFAALTPGLAQAAEPCTPIAGAEDLVQRPNLHWLVVGELHGTKELPAAFGDLACIAAKVRGKPVTIGLEFPPDEQPRFDAYMASTGDAAARAALTQGATWRHGMRDGRSSEAMLALIDRVRVMKAQGWVIRLLAIRKQAPFTPGKEFDPAAGELLIGEGMREAGTADGLTLILIGNVHAAVRKFGNLAYAPAASVLPADQTVTLNFVYGSGDAWICTMPQPGAAVTCQGRHLGGQPAPGSRAIRFDPSPDMPWSGLFSAGTAISASPPAVPEDKAKPSS